jgi:hypothetical protein
LGDVFSEDALKLARAIYNTYIENDKDLYMEIHIKKIKALLKIEIYDSKRYITYLFEEINEPIGVRNFKYYADEYQIRFLVFCSYEIVDEIVKIYLSEEFLYAEKIYMIDNFLTN